MKIAQIGRSPVHQAPLPNGPEVEVVLDAGNNLSVAHVSLPPGASMPDHSHGDAEAVVIVRAGQVELASGDEVAILGPGKLALVGVGERVRLRNGSPEPASLVAVFAPSGFIATFKEWPIRDAVTSVSIP